MNPPTEPGWGPPAQPPPQPPRWGEPGYTNPNSPHKLSRGRIIFVVAIAIAGLFLAVAVADNDAPTASQATNEVPGYSAEDDMVEANPATETTEATTDTKATGPITAAVGGTIQFEDSFGDHAVDVTVVRKKVSTGTEFDGPDHGLYVGFHIRAKAFQNGISIPDFYVVENGRRYEATIVIEGFRPDLRTYGELNAGEDTAGWIVFDVPARTGKLVMTEFLSDEPQAIWRF